MKRKKRNTPTTADEWLALSDDERHELVQRMLAERIAYHERKLSEEAAIRGKATSH